MYNTITMLKTFAVLVALVVSSTVRAETKNPQIICLAQNMYHEARGEGDRGMIAVSNVVMNRVESGRFPSTPCGVIHQRTNRSCQFSWVCYRNKIIRERDRYNRALTIATQIYHDRLADVTNGALFYHANYVRPVWTRRMTRTASIGSHAFYRG